MNHNSGPRGLSVGGPNGIHIDGGNVQVGGMSIGGQRPMYEPAAAPALDNLAQAPGFVVRHAGLVAAALGASACLLVGSVAVVVAFFGLPWLILAGPGVVSAVLVGAGVGVVVRARKRITTAGIEPEVERRLLDAAVACGGRLTVTAAARALSIPMAEADATLTALAKSGHVGIENDPASGVVVYVFPDIEAGLVPMRRLP